MSKLYLLSLTASEEKREGALHQLTKLVEAFGEAVEIIETGRRALTIEVQNDATLPQLIDKTADIADLQLYEGLKPIKSKKTHLRLL